MDAADATKKASVFERLGAGPTGPTGSAPAAASVFDRLGSSSTASAGADTAKWGHDGFEELHGKASSRKTNKAARPAPYGADMHCDRMAKSKKPTSKDDLRRKLSGGGGGGGDGKPIVKRGKGLPDECPW